MATTLKVHLVFLSVMIDFIGTRAQTFVMDSAVILNEAFANRPFTAHVSESSIHLFLAGDLKKTEKETAGDVPGRTDTLIIYSSACCVVEFLHVAGKSIFYDATILTDEIKLAQRVMIGMSKTDFGRLFKIPSDKINNNIFVVGNADGSCNHSFYFEDDKLFSIAVSGCGD